MGDTAQLTFSRDDLAIFIYLLKTIVQGVHESVFISEHLDTVRVQQALIIDGVMNALVHAAGSISSARHDLSSQRIECAQILQQRNT